MDRKLKTIKELKNEYPSLKVWADHLIPAAYKKILEEQLITEFLYTINPIKTSSQIQKQLGDVVYVDFIRRDNEIIKIKLTFKDKLENDIKKVNDFMDKFGWYPSFIDTKNGGKYSNNVIKFFGFKNISVIYEPKYENKEIEINEKYIYHITPDIKWPKIRTNGLTPKNQMKISDHPERIYLLKNINNLESFGGDITEISFRLLQDYPYKDKVKDMYLLEIDVSKLNDIVFFEDLNFWIGEGIWTYQGIPPNAISIKEKINMIY
jgi:hypothetical protein